MSGIGVDGPLTTEQRRATLRAFDRALSREAHVLSGRPDLLWQQVYNRLQWAKEPIPRVMSRELERRTAPGSRPWFRLKTPLPESGALIRTLAGHTGSVTACAISPDGRWIVSGSEDHTLKIWDAATGAERKTLWGHDYSVNVCAISPDGRWIASASLGRNLVWDAVTGAERATLWGHTGGVSACAISPDGRWIVSAGGGWRDHTLKVWEAATGVERATLRGHTDVVIACAISPDGRWIVSASDDQTLKVWDAATGAARATLPLPGRLASLALHPLRPFAACGDRNGHVYFIDCAGIAYGPIIVTAVDAGKGPVVRCPACLQSLPLRTGWLGHEVACPGPGCEARMRVNPFVTKVRRASPWLVSTLTPTVAPPGRVVNTPTGRALSLQALSTATRAWRIQHPSRPGSVSP